MERQQYGPEGEPWEGRPAMSSLAGANRVLAVAWEWGAAWPTTSFYFIYGMYFYAADSGTVWCIRFVHRLIPVYSLTRVLLYMGGGRGEGSNVIYGTDPKVSRA